MSKRLAASLSLSSDEVFLVPLSEAASWPIVVEGKKKMKL